MLQLFLFFFRREICDKANAFGGALSTTDPRINPAGGNGVFVSSAYSNVSAQTYRKSKQGVYTDFSQDLKPLLAQILLSHILYKELTCKEKHCHSSGLSWEGCGEGRKDFAEILPDTIVRSANRE